MQHFFEQMPEPWETRKPSASRVMAEPSAAYFSALSSGGLLGLDHPRALDLLVSLFLLALG
jgi:hypothetical protein